MFANISLNDEKGSGKRIGELSLKNLDHQFSYGRDEWQQEWKSHKNREYTSKPIFGNRVKLEQNYLKPNYSDFELVHFPNKQPFLTSNRRDFKTHNLKEAKVESKIKKDFILASKIVLGDNDPNFMTTNQEILNNPKEQRSRMNYDKIKFNYESYNVHPLTSELIHKPTHNNWNFDYWNRDKPKHSVSNDRPQFVNNDLRRVYDPITNRYFKQ